MSKIKYQDINMRDSTLELISAALAIISEYTSAGFRLTVRQLFYQFVARDKLPNTERSYKNLGKAISKGRLAGLIPWDAIEDRTRYVRSNDSWESTSDLVRSAARWWNFDKWSRQNNYVEVWIEKDALIGVIENICSSYDVPFFSCRGYGSQSALWEAAQRLGQQETHGKNTFVLHLGDHDPSGIDMTRDIEERLRLFTADTEVRRLALNMPQIREINPPPNPSKTTDPRSTGYIDTFGPSSWELDALDPRYMEELIESELGDLIDPYLWDEDLQYQEEQREKLMKVSQNWQRVEDFVATL